MGTIVFTADQEEGNLFASFGLAKQLQAKGHQIIYAGVADAEALIVRENLTFFPLLKSVYPSGSKYTAWRATNPTASRDALCSLFFSASRELDLLIDHLRPDVVIVPPYLALEGFLLKLRYRLSVAFLRTSYFIQSRRTTIERGCAEVLEASSFREEILAFLKEFRIDATDIGELIQLISEIPELVTLPPLFEPCEVEQDPNTYHIGSTTDWARTEHQLDLNFLQRRKAAVFCTLGSQCDIEASKSKLFFETLLDAFRKRPDWALILSIGKGLSTNDFTPPSNVLMTNWAPQLAILPAVDMMITHGGIGTMRECILAGVPMLAYPLMRDQFASADAIATHGIGLVGSLEAVTPDELIDQIQTVLESASMKEHTRSLRHRFVSCEREERGADAVQRLFHAAAQI